MALTSVRSASLAGVVLLATLPVCSADLDAIPRDERVTLANWMAPPFNRWSLQHVPQILPVSTVDRGDREVAELPERPRPLDDVRFETPTGEEISVSEWLAASSTDGFIVLQDGRIVFEAYLNGMRPQTRHLTFSISKSLIGILAGVLVDDGDLDPARKVEDYVPELLGSAFEGYRVRDLLDMLAAVEWQEDYADSGSQWRRWKEAIGWLPVTGESGHLPVGNYEYLTTLRRDAEWRGGFKYVSATTEAAGWVLERAGGMPLAELLSRKLWRALGAQRDAYITTDSSGAAGAAGGFGATLRDLARFGQMVLQEGSVEGRVIVSRDWIDDIRFGGSNADWRRGLYRGFWNPEGAYRSYWYVTGDADGCFEAIGIHGQRLRINPARKLVFVRLSSHPEASSRDDYGLASTAIAAIRAAL